MATASLQTDGEVQTNATQHALSASASNEMATWTPEDIVTSPAPNDGARSSDASYTPVLENGQNTRDSSESKSAVTEAELFSFGHVAKILWFCTSVIKDEPDAVYIMRPDFTRIIVALLKVVAPTWDSVDAQQIATEIFQKTMPKFTFTKQTMDFVTFTKGIWMLSTMFHSPGSAWHVRALWIAKVNGIYVYMCALRVLRVHVGCKHV
jgi:hypothetical protein